LERLAEQMHHAGGRPFALAWQESERQGGAAASASAAPLLSLLRALRQAAPHDAAERSVQQDAEPLADKPLHAEEAAAASPTPAQPVVAVPDFFGALSSAYRLDNAEPELISLPGVDLDALVADDARVTDALDAWASGDLDALRLPLTTTDDTEETLEELSQRADEELRAFMQELELQTAENP
jgi:hypothetical protein